MQDYGMEYAELSYYSPTEWDKRSGMWPVRAGRNMAKPNFKAGPKSIDCYSLHFVMDGTVELQYEYGSVELRPGDLFCLYPNTRYEYTQSSRDQTPLRMCWLAMDGGQVPELLRLAGITMEKPYTEQVMSWELERQLVKTLAAFTEAEKPGKYAKLTGCLYSLFSELQSAEHSAAAPGMKEDWIEHSVRFMQIHCCERITVEEIAQAVGIHRSYYSTKFAERMGLPPVKYLQKLRMEKAAQLLRETELPVTEIAYTVGYPELYAFTRFFTHYYGMPPSKYRAK